MNSELLAIKNSVEQFKNAKFNCADFSKNIVYIENTENNGIYGIKFAELEKGFEFDATNPEIIQKPKSPRHEFLENAKELKSAVSDIFVFEDKVYTEDLDDFEYYLTHPLKTIITKIAKTGNNPQVIADEIVSKIDIEKVKEMLTEKGTINKSQLKSAIEAAFQELQIFNSKNIQSNVELGSVREDIEELAAKKIFDIVAKDSNKKAGFMEEKISKLSNVLKKINLNAEYFESQEQEIKERSFSEFEQKFEKSIIAYEEEKNEFLNSIELFDKDGDIKKIKINSKDLNKYYAEEFINEISGLYSKINLFNDYVEHFQQYASTDEAKAFIKKSVLNLNKKGDIPKMCLMLKTEYSEDIDIAATTKELTHYIEAEAPEFAFNYSKAEVDSPKFLKIMTDKYTPSDLMTLSGELGMAFSRMYSNMDPEQMKLLSQLQQRCDYMVQTQKISDHVMQDIIDTFNKTFGKDQANEVVLPPVVSQVPAIAQEVAIPLGIEIPGDNTNE